MLDRATTWLTAWHGEPVPYSMSTDPATWFGGYRRDCSGYVSMALGLPGPGLTTAELAARSTPITKTDLQPGDLLINPAHGGAGHVVIFERWADPEMTSYLGYEQSGDGGTHHRVIPYAYFGRVPAEPVPRWLLACRGDLGCRGRPRRFVEGGAVSELRWWAGGIGPPVDADGTAGRGAAESRP